jgi:hypothetical protein
MTVDAGGDVERGVLLSLVIICPFAVVVSLAFPCCMAVTP